MKELENPIKNAKYAAQITDIKKKNNSKDIIRCPICSKTYTRSNVWAHKKTQYHKLFEKMNNKIKDFLLQ
jgi:hypothetical protein